MTLLAEAYGKAGNNQEALKIIDQTSIIVEKTGEHYWDAEFFRLQGELFLKNEDARAEKCFLQAINIARTQQAKSLELRAIMSLSRLRRSQGSQEQIEEADRLLSKVYNWFTEGFATPDLQKAYNLLLE